MKKSCEFQGEECCKYKMYCEYCPIESAKEQSDGDIEEDVITFYEKIMNDCITKEKECITIIGGICTGLYTDIVYEIVDEEGCHWDDVATWLWCGIFGFCGCGDIKYDILKIYKTLKMYSNKQLLPYSLQIYAYILDRWEFVEHGSSIFSAVLTKKGEALLYLLENETHGWDDAIKIRDEEDERRKQNEKRI